MKKLFNGPNGFLLANALIAMALMVASGWLLRETGQKEPPEFRLAADYMERSLDVIRVYCQENGINQGNPEDPANTGMIGPEWSDITTTLGDPAAKRTTVNPAFAALIASYLEEAGISKGDTIAIGSSASFPALLIASLSAARALDLHPIVIFSFGSSSFGASNPDFTIWDLYRVLLGKGLFNTLPVAASLGGEQDTGQGFEPQVAERLAESLEKEGIPLINEPDLSKNVGIRCVYYFGETANADLPFSQQPDRLRPAHSRIKAFINSGGGFANLGTSPLVLNIKPGLVRHATLPDPGRRGMIHSMLERHIPVIHLLYIKGLTLKHHLPWDPASRPPYQGLGRGFRTRPGMAVYLPAIVVLAWFVLFLVRFRMLNNRR